MTGHDIVVIGGSAGGLEALRQVVAGLPKDLPAAVFAVIHQVPYRPSCLPELLGKCGVLPARHPADREEIRPRLIYVAPPDCHLLVGDGQVRVVRGPREHHTRPAVDPLFRSAAVNYGSRTVGVVLSGYLDDGTAGLTAIHSQGGLAVVQNCSDAIARGMPENAARAVPSSIRLKAAEIGPELSRLVRQPAAPRISSVLSELAWEVAVATWNFAALDSASPTRQPAPFARPDCGGDS